MCFNMGHKSSANLQMRAAAAGPGHTDGRFEAGRRDRSISIISGGRQSITGLFRGNSVYFYLKDRKVSDSRIHNNGE